MSDVIEIRKARTLLRRILRPPAILSSSSA
jgi:hypothetical protein